MAKIVLIGFMGAGKSTIGLLLSEQMQIPYIDVDEAIAEQEQMSITDIFNQHGESYFRKREQQKLVELIDQDAIIATGGGIVLQEDNRVLLMNHSSPVVYLKTSPSKFLNRLKNDTSRPLVTAKTAEEITAIFASRADHYSRCADHTILTDSKSPAEIAHEILNLIHKKSSKLGERK